MVGNTARKTVLHVTLYVTNIDDERITQQDITQLFGLAATPFLKKQCKTEITVKSGVRHAIIVLPEEISVEIMKLNGVKMYGKALKISKTLSLTTEDPREDDGDIIAMELDCRVGEWAIDQVTETEVCDALLLQHPEDPTKAVKKMFGSMMGVFRIQSVDFEPYLDSSLTIRGRELKLKPIRLLPFRGSGDNRTYNFSARSRNFDPDGVRVTIYDSYDLKFRDITGEEFDNYFHELGIEIIKPTTPQTHRERRDVLTTHRFIVVKNIDQQGNKIDLGTEIRIGNSSFKIGYFGKQAWCRLCGVKHGKECPSKARFQILQELRKEDLKKRKVYSDSTLRHTNQLALSSDVSCMSGGGIGQICNLIHVDEKHDQVIINAGTNEIKTESLHEFVYTVSKAEEKLQKLAATHDVTVVVPCFPAVGAAETAKAQYLEEKMNSIKEIKTIKMTNIEWDDRPPHRHPTEKGTLEIIKQIHQNVGDLIMDNCEPDVICPMKYRQVKPVYKVGCRGCDNLDYAATLCQECKVAAKEVDVRLLEDLIRNLEAKLFPPIEIDNTVYMREIAKRTNDGNNPEASIAKAAKTD